MFTTLNFSPEELQDKPKLEEFKFLVPWFYAAFESNPAGNYGYFCTWCSRYNRGLDWFVANMDSKRRALWVKYTRFMIDRV